MACTHEDYHCHSSSFAVMRINVSVHERNTHTRAGTKKVNEIDFECRKGWIWWWVVGWVVQYDFPKRNTVQFIRDNEKVLKLMWFNNAQPLEMGKYSNEFIICTIPHDRHTSYFTEIRERVGCWCCVCVVRCTEYDVRVQKLRGACALSSVFVCIAWQVYSRSISPFLCPSRVSPMLAEVIFNKFEITHPPSIRRCRRRRLCSVVVHASFATLCHHEKWFRSHVLARNTHKTNSSHTCKFPFAELQRYSLCPSADNNACRANSLTRQQCHIETDRIYIAGCRSKKRAARKWKSPATIAIVFVLRTLAR